MTRNWTFARKIAGGFAVVVGLAVVTGVVAIVALTQVVAEKDYLLTVYVEDLIDAQRLDAAMAKRMANVRAFLLTGESRYEAEIQVWKQESQDIIAALERRAESDRAIQLVKELDATRADYMNASERAIAEKKAGGDMASVARTFESDVTPRRENMQEALAALVDLVEGLMNTKRDKSTEGATLAVTSVTIVTSGAVLAALLLGIFLARALSRRIGEAVQHVQNSSVECQAAANQQAAGAKSQATSMSEIATTISELLVTSRQIAESSQRVAHIADETNVAARDGDRTVRLAQESIAAIKKQVDLTVTHMLELGKTSQQIGVVLDLINELADQTNILAINATIEAAGAGEAGSRFAVVADEIRKLSDRVTGSTKEVRGLIDGIRASVNATVMSTESGSKAADSGARQFGDVTTSFNRIAHLVGTTTEAAREIELSTKQQSSAVEQVNIAIANVAQATRETEASSAQTLQTASQLAGLSRELSRLIQPSESA